MPTCDQATIDANAKLAEQIDPNRNYMGVLVVIVAVFPNGSVEIGIDNDPNDPNKRHTVKWGDLAQMWPLCPTSFSTTLPRIGDQGTLYLSIDYLNQYRIVAATPKWPRVQ